jgi:hypothetical protein
METILWIIFLILLCFIFNWGADNNRKSKDDGGIR